MARAQTPTWRWTISLQGASLAGWGASSAGPGRCWREHSVLPLLPRQQSALEWLLGRYLGT